MDHVILVSFKITCIMVKVYFNGLVYVCMKANFIMESSMDKENLNLTNMIFMRVSLKIMSFMVKEN